MKELNLGSNLFSALNEVRHSLLPSSLLYQWLAEHLSVTLRARHFEAKEKFRVVLGEAGPLSMIYEPMGAIDTIHLFGLDELILFGIYHAEKKRYRRVVDGGANVGLHSLVLGKLGYEVQAYEPDPVTFMRLQEHLKLNAIQSVDARQAAISLTDGQAEFTRVKGNTTSSHLSGAKVPYGDLEKFTVKTVAFKSLLHWADLMKLDVEGHEAELLCATTASDWKTTDMLMEIGNAENAARIWSHLSSQGLRLFSQKRGWSRVETLADIPTSYREGSLFITARDEWSP